MATQVALFLCPSDGAPPPAVGSGPTITPSAPATAPTAATRPTPTARSSWVRPQSVANLTDGTSQTAAASEQLLGIAGPYSQTTPTPVPSPWSRAMARVAAGPLTDAACARASDGWLLNKGSSWWDGNYQNTLYNHYLTPNALRPDCIVYHNPGWKAARSLHPGGVNAALLRRPRRFRQGLGRSGDLAGHFHPRRRRDHRIRRVLTIRDRPCIHFVRAVIDVV